MIIPEESDRVKNFRSNLSGALGRSIPVTIFAVHAPVFVAKLAVVVDPVAIRMRIVIAGIVTVLVRPREGRVVTLGLDSIELLCELADLQLDLFDAVHLNSNVSVAES